MGLTTGASLAFDGTPGSYADTKASRSLANKSFSIDMMVKPDNTNLDDIFFMHGSGDDLLLFAKERPGHIVITHVFTFFGYIHRKLAEYKRQLVVKEYVTPFLDH